MDEIISKKERLGMVRNQAQKIIQTADEVAFSTAQEADQLAFMSKCFIQATLPHSNPGNVPLWWRKSGNYTLSIQPDFIPGSDGKPKNLGLPYGSIPRLILAWANAEAVRNQSRELVLGKSLADFMEKIGFESATGGRNGSITRLKAQSVKLFSSKISLTYTDKSRFSISNALLADYAEYFWDPIHPEQHSLWESRIVLSEKFYQLLLSAPVPLDWRILKSLKRSPMALDLYMWLSYRVFSIEKSQKIRWETLSEQFGSEYDRVRDFRLNVRKHILKIQAIWGTLDIDLSNDTWLEIKPSPLLIKSKEKNSLFKTL